MSWFRSKRWDEGAQRERERKIKIEENRSNLYRSIASDDIKAVQAAINALDGDLTIINGLSVRSSFKCPAGQAPIHLAAELGRRDILELLLHHGAKTDLVNKYNQKPLDLALQNNQLECVLLLLSYVTLTPDAHPGLLEFFVTRDSVVGLMVLADAAVNMNQALPSGETPLMIACKAISYEVLEALMVSFEADVNAESNDGMTPLLYLCSAPKLRELRGVVNSVASPLGLKALTCLNLLIAQGCNLRAKRGNQGQRNCLHMATEKGWLQGLAVLLSNLNRNTSEEEKEGDGKERDSVELRQYSAMVNAVDEYGMTPLHYAAQNHDSLQSSVECMKLLFQFGAVAEITKLPIFVKPLDEHVARNGLWTPLHAACAVAGSAKDDEIPVAIVQFLIEQGANVNAEDVNGNIPLHYICSGITILGNNSLLDYNKASSPSPINTKIVELLIDAGANVNAISKRSRYPIHYAARSRSLECARLLLLKGAAVNALDSDGRHPLFLSVLGGDYELTQALLQMGADKDLVDNNGKSLVSVAEGCGNARIVALFQIENMYYWGVHNYQAMYSPFPLNALKGVNVIMAASGDGHNFFLTDTGVLYAWGSNEFGQLGVGKKKQPRTTPVKVTALENKFIKQIGCGAFHSVALDDVGNVYSWGKNTEGRLGQPMLRGKGAKKPSAIDSLKQVYITQIAIGVAHNMALSDKGKVYVWGVGFGGRLGLGDAKEYSEPTPIPSLDDIQFIACGVGHSIAVSASNTIYSWGVGSLGRLGNGSNDNELVPCPLKDLGDPSSVVQIACGCYHNLVLLSSGSVYSFGGNAYGQLGLGTQDKFASTPTLIPLDAHACQISCGYNHSTILTESGEVYGFGLNEKGQAGQPIQHYQVTWPSKVPLPDKAYNIASGSETTLAVTGAPRVMLGDILKKVYHEAQNYFSDVTFTIGDDTLYAHQVILGARSPLFRKMFEEKLAQREFEQGKEKEKESENESGKEKEKEKEEEGKEKEKEWESGEIDFDALDAEAQHEGGGREAEEEGEADVEPIRFTEEELKVAILSYQKERTEKQALATATATKKGEEKGKKDFGYESFSKFVEYCYTDRLDGKSAASTNNKFFEELKILAKKHSMVRLVAICKRDRVNLPQSNLHSDLGQFINNPQFSDVRFLLQGQPIYAHKVILCARVDYFSALFHSGMREASQKSITVTEEVEPTVYLALMSYIYTDKIEVTPDEAVELLSLSNQYDISRLQQKCESVATKGVDFDNVAYVWKLAKLYNTPKLREFCSGIIVKHYSVVSHSESFQYLEREDVEELSRLVRH